jgi:ATP-dependent exoDNAse (exonuclease V) alpha subunit
MTINKSQRQTYDRVGVDLQKNVFTHGQLYVSLSRVRSRDNVVKNIVYREILAQFK